MNRPCLKPVLLFLLLIICLPSFGQNVWIKTPKYKEDLAKKAFDEGNYPLAIIWYKDALNLRKESYPEGIHCSIRALKEVSSAMGNLMNAHSKAGNYEEHIALGKELSEWSKKGMDLFPDDSSPYLEYGLTQIQIAESHQALKQYDKGAKVCQDLINYYQRPDGNKRSKFVAKQIVPFAHSRAGEILKDQGDLAASVVQHQKSVEGWQIALKDIDATMIFEEIAQQSEICVQRFAKLENSANALKYGGIAHEFYTKLLNLDPENSEYTEKVKGTANTLAQYNSERGEYEKAIAHYLNSLAINERQFEQSKANEFLFQMTAINLKISECYASINDLQKSAKFLASRVDLLQQLQAIDTATDYSYTISRNQFSLAKKHEELDEYEQALKIMDQSIALHPIIIAKDPENTRKKEWQWIQEYFRYELLMELEKYETASSTLDRLRGIFTELEKLGPEFNYYEHIKEVNISQSELAYPNVIELRTEIEDMNDGPEKLEKSCALVKLLKKKMKKDPDMKLSYLKHTTLLAWTGLMIGEYKTSQKALKRAMRLKPVDPYLIINYAPSLLFQGKYKKADKVYDRYYDDPFKPGQKIVDGYLNDFEEFEQKGVIPEIHRQKVEEIKARLTAWKSGQDE